LRNRLLQRHHQLCTAGAVEGYHGDAAEALAVACEEEDAEVGAGEPDMDREKSDINRIAIAADGSGVSSHFGHCEKFAIFHIRNNDIIHQEFIISPGHEPGKLPRLLASCGVTHVLAGGMGIKAIQLFEEQGIGVILGIQGPIDEVAECFALDRLVAGKSMCNHDQCGH
jgi:predicted Fe-Mo cluster-binding NifX family protein